MKTRASPVGLQRRHRAKTNRKSPRAPARRRPGKGMPRAPKGVRQNPSLTPRTGTTRGSGRSSGSPSSFPGPSHASSCTVASSGVVWLTAAGAAPEWLMASTSPASRLTHASRTTAGTWNGSEC